MLKKAANCNGPGVTGIFLNVNSHHKIWAALILGGMGGAGLYFLFHFDLYHQVTSVVNERTPAGLFIGLMLVLPMAGVPMSIFLFLLGIKFGIGYGLLILEIIMPLQLLVAYGVVRFFRSPVEKYLVVKKGYQIPRIPPDRVLVFSVLFLFIPGLPYAVKIYLLPLAAVPFRYCFWLNWGIQGTLSIPFVLLGKSAADMNAVLFGLTLALCLVLVLVLKWARKRYGELQKKQQNARNGCVVVDESVLTPSKKSG
ncbi:MAG: hypothetical protein C4548_09045 [Desulfobacteraceae bacterium]|nr:MAG: hypothetical protein C4548_09045 [Desulfobacteraceae bacterium]